MKKSSLIYIYIYIVLSIFAVLSLFNFNITSKYEFHNNIISANLNLKKEYYITYNLDGGTHSNPIKYNINSVPFTLKVPIKSGYTFLGWTGSNGTIPQTEVTITKDNLNDLNYTANYTINSYYFDVNLGSNVTSFDIEVNGSKLTNQTDYYKQLPFGTIATITNVKVKSGYTYSGYTVGGSTIKEADSTNSKIKVKLGAANGSVTLNSSANSVNVTFNGNGGTIAKNGMQTFTYGKGQKFADTGVTRTGYTLLGWSENKSATTAQYSTLSNVSDGWIGNGGTKTLYAIWKINQYSFKVTKGGGLASFDITVNGAKLTNQTSYSKNLNYGTSVVITNVKVNNGYNYSGYTTGGSTIKQSGSTNSNIKVQVGAGASTVTLNNTYQEGVFAKLYDTNNDGKGDHLILNNTINFTGTGKLISNYNNQNENLKMPNVIWADNKEQITKVTINNTIKPTNVNGWFYKFTKATSFNNLSKINLSNCKNMSGLFSNCSSVTSLSGIENWNVSNITDMNSLFAGCSKLTSLNLSKWNTSKVTSFAWAFQSCTNLQTLNLQNWNTSNCTTMQCMFQYCSNLSNLSFTQNTFNTAKVTTMNYMFDGCSKLTSLNLRGFNTARVTNMAGMFYNNTSLTRIYASNNFNTSKVTNSAEMFRGCEKLVGGSGTKFSWNYMDKSRAKIDGGTSNPGYFTK